MCFPVSCSSCGKTTWSGCGRHVASVHKQINQGQHCMCKPWPGFKIEGSANTPQDILVVSAPMEKSEAKADQPPAGVETERASSRPKDVPAVPAPMENSEAEPDQPLVKNC